jgi:hypothetical protein
VRIGRRKLIRAGDSGSNRDVVFHVVPLRAELLQPVKSNVWYFHLAVDKKARYVITTGISSTSQMAPELRVSRFVI